MATLTTPGKDTSAQTRASSMTRDPKAVKCKSCAQVLATASPAGLVPVQASHEQQDGCGTCRQFQPLYDAMLAAEKEYASHADRRDSYRPKQDAFVNFKRTRLEFNNWLMSVEALAEAHDEALHSQPTRQDKAGATESGVQLGTKRARSSDSRPQSPISPSNAQPGTDSLSERKRLKFSESVEFRDDYRPSNRYSRNDEAYEKGRHAPPEGSKYLDTSGSAVSFLKFTGAKKVGKMWIDVWKDEDHDEDAQNMGKEKAKEEKNAEGVTQLEDENEKEDADSTQVTEPLLDPRSQRLMRKGSASTKEEWKPGPSRKVGCPEDATPAKLNRSVTAEKESTPNCPTKTTEEEYAEHADRPKTSSNGLLAGPVFETDKTEKTLKKSELGMILSVEPEAPHEVIGSSNDDDRSSQPVVDDELCGAAQAPNLHIQDQDALKKGQIQPKNMHTNGGDTTVATEATTGPVPARKEAQGTKMTVISPTVPPTSKEQGSVMQRVAAEMQSLPKEGDQETHLRLDGGLGVAADTVTALHDDANSHAEKTSSPAVPAYQCVEVDHCKDVHQGMASNAMAAGPAVNLGNLEPRPVSEAPHLTLQHPNPPCTHKMHNNCP